MTRVVPIDADWPLVLLPGTLCDQRVFGPMLADAAMPERTVLHARMTGLADAQALARRVLADAPARFIPIGFSLGAIVALEMAAIAPQRIGAMVLMAANGRDVPAADHAARRAAADADPATFVGQLWPRSVAADRQGDKPLRTLIADMACGAPVGTLPLQTELALTRRDKRPLLAAMTMPTLVLGGAQDQIAPPFLQEELASGLPCAALRITPDAGHFLPLECPDFCAGALAEWLAPVPARP